MKFLGKRSASLAAIGLTACLALGIQSRNAISPVAVRTEGLLLRLGIPVHGPTQVSTVRIPRRSSKIHVTQGKCIVDYDSKDLSLEAVYSGLFSPDTVSASHRPKLVTGQLLPKSKLVVLALSYARTVGLPASATLLESRAGTQVVMGSTNSIPTFTALYGHRSIGFPDHPSAQPRMVVIIEATTGKLWSLFNEWRFIRQPFKTQDLKHTKAEATQKAFEITAPNIRSSRGIHTTKDLATTLEYVYPHRDVRSGLRPKDESFPRKTFLAYVVRGNKLEVWLDPKTLDVLGTITLGW